MAWTNITILGLGGLLVLVPVVLHFLMQPKPKQMLFPAIRFLQERESSNRSRMRLRHLLLLIMRCLLIALLTLALAGLPHSDSGRYYGEEQIESRMFTVRHAYKAARTLARECVQK